MWLLASLPLADETRGRVGGLHTKAAWNTNENLCQAGISAPRLNVHNHLRMMQWTLDEYLQKNKDSSYRSHMC